MNKYYNDFDFSPRFNCDLNVHICDLKQKIIKLGKCNVIMNKKANK